MGADRDDKGRFLPGHPGGPGRPRRAVELEYLAILADGVPLRRWKKIIARAVADAEAGDPKARRWLGELLMGKEPATLTALAATELAETLDDEIRAQAAGLRTTALRKKLLNRTSEHPDLGEGRPAGRGEVGGGSSASPTHLGARQPGRNGHPA